MTADRTPPLRDQIAEALPCPVCPAQAGEPCYRAREDNQQPHMSRRLRADAVLHAIEPHMLAITVDATQRADLLAGRLEQAERERDTAREALDAAAIVITSLRDQRDEQRQRAENAERQREQALNAIADERRGKLTAEAAARRVRQVLNGRARLCGPDAVPSVPVAAVRAALDADQPKETR